MTRKLWMTKWDVLLTALTQHLLRDTETNEKTCHNIIPNFMTNTIWNVEKQVLIFKCVLSWYAYLTCVDAHLLHTEAD